MLGQIQIQVVAAEPAAHDPFLAVRSPTLLAASVSFAVAAATIHRSASFGAALGTTTMADAVAPALLHVRTAFVEASLAAPVGLAQLEILCRALAAFDGAHQLAPVASTALVHLADLVAAVDDALAPSAMCDAVAAAEVVLGAAQSFAALARTLVLDADASADGPVLAFLHLALLAAAVAFAEAAASIHLDAVFDLALLAAAVRDAKAAADIALFATIVLAEPPSAVGFAEAGHRQQKSALANQQERGESNGGITTYPPSMRLFSQPSIGQSGLPPWPEQ